MPIIKYSFYHEWWISLVTLKPVAVVRILGLINACQQEIANVQSRSDPWDEYCLTFEFRKDLGSKFYT